MSAPIRVLLAKLGPDGQDRSVQFIARALRDAGMDVIYAGPHRSCDEVVTAAIQEDADVLGISFVSSAETAVFPKALVRLKNEGAEDMIVIAGGAIPNTEIAALKKAGVHEVLGEDMPPQAIVDTLRRLVAARRPR